MRLVTATEKYRAVNEGTMAKKEFVRQMRQEFPQYISQFNGFKDSVTILKNKGLIFETKPTGTEIYDERPAANIDLTRLERGIFYELQAAGLKPPFDDRNVTTEEYLKAAKKAKDNLIKYPNYYIDIVAGESTNVDKHDREVPVKRGELKKDLFNDLKKAELKEAKKMLKEGRLEDLAETLGITLEKLQSAVSSIREIEDEVVGEVEDEVGEVMGIDRKGNEKPDTGVGDATKYKAAAKNLKENIASAIGAIHDKYGEIPGINMLIKEFIRTHHQDIMDGADPIEEFNEFISVNYPGPSDMMGADGLGEAEVELSDDETARLKAKGELDRDAKLHGTMDEREGDDHHYIKIPRAQFKKAEAIIAKNIDGNKVKMDYVDNDGAGNAIIYFMFDDGDIASGEANSFTYDAVRDLETYDIKVADHSAEMDEGEVIHHDCANHVLHEKYGHGICLEGQHTLLEDGTVTHYDVFFKEGSKTVKSIPLNELEVINSSHHGHKRKKNEDEIIEADPIPTEPGISKMGDDGKMHNVRASNHDRKMAMRNVIDILRDELSVGTNDALDYIRTHKDDLFSGEVDAYDKDEVVRDFKEYESVNEKKGKDHDGDGDVDGDDYMHAKDKAIKKAMGKDEQLKEAIKGLIKKSLNEDTINEAATQELAALADTYGGYKGMQVVLNDLQNIVTDIESYQAKTKEKLQNVFNKVGDVENEDGLKVGAFLAPAIESAFNKDSRMVGGNRLMKGVNIPKVKFMSKDIETPQNETSPKQTVFAPVKRYF